MTVEIPLLSLFINKNLEQFTLSIYEYKPDMGCDFGHAQHKNHFT